jgi:hypothetical protein
MSKSNKGGQAGVVTIVLVLVIILVLGLILWNIVIPLIVEKTKSVDTKGLFVTLTINEVILFPTENLKVTLSRTGAGEINGLVFVFEGGGSSAIREVKENLIMDGERRTYSFTPVIELSNITGVRVMPIVGEKTGSESESKKIIFDVPEGIVSWWRFDKDTDDYLDKNNCNPGSLIINDSLNGEISCVGNPSLDISEEIALSFWIKTSLDGEILSKGDNYKVLLENGIIKFVYAGENLTGDDFKNLKDGLWHHVVVGTMGVWVDGEPQNINKIQNSGVPNTDNLIIGDSNFQVDEIMFFNKSIANTQIQGIYNLQRGNFI